MRFRDYRRQYRRYILNDRAAVWHRGRGFELYLVHDIDVGGQSMLVVPRETSKLLETRAKRP